MNERIRVGQGAMSRLEAQAVVESAAMCCEQLPADKVARLVRAAQRANRTLQRQQRHAGAARPAGHPGGGADNGNE